jgi:hypothetical protein
MKRIILSIILSFFVVGSASAGGYGYNRGYYNNPWAYGGAFLGGAVIGGLLARPYYAPPPVYYAPPAYYPPPPVYYAPPPVAINPGSQTAPQGYQWSNVWDSVCQCNRAVLIPE